MIHAVYDQNKATTEKRMKLDRIIRKLYACFCLMATINFLPVTSYAVIMRKISGEKVGPSDTSAINLNFDTLRNLDTNVVHKTSTETISGSKYFKGKNPWADVRGWGAVGNGILNDRAAFVSADSIATGSSIFVPYGNYLISSNLTITSPVIFMPGAVLLIPNGVTVTFLSAPALPNQQVFSLSGTGTVVFPKQTAEYNVRWWGAVGDGVKTNNDVPINQAILAAYTSSAQNGSLVHVPTGNYLISGQITIKNKVVLRGTNCRDTEIEINAGTWNGDTHLIYFDGSSALFNTRIEDLSLKVDNVTSVTSAIYSGAWNEQSGVKRCLISNFTNIGILSETGTGGSAVFEIEEVELGGSAISTATTGISLATDATIAYANAMLRHITVTGGSGGHNLTNGIAVSSRVICNIDGIHGEQATSVISLTGNSHLVGHGLTGSPTAVTNVIRVDTNFSGLIHVTGARTSGAAILLLDQKGGSTQRNGDISTEPLIYPILTGSRALASDSSGDVSATSVTSTELSYVSGVTSAIQTQMADKISRTGPTVASIMVTNSILYGYRTVNDATATGIVDLTLPSSNGSDDYITADLIYTIFSNAGGTLSSETGRVAIVFSHDDSGNDVNNIVKYGNVQALDAGQASMSVVFTASVASHVLTIKVNSDTATNVSSTIIVEAHIHGGYRAGTMGSFSSGMTSF